MIWIIPRKGSPILRAAKDTTRDVCKLHAKCDLIQCLIACLLFSMTYQVDHRTCISLKENAFHVNEKNQI